MKTLITISLMLFTYTLYAQNTRTIVNIVPVSKHIHLDIQGDVEIIKSPKASRIVIETVIDTNFPEHINLALAKRWEVKTDKDNTTNTTIISFKVSEKVPFYQGTQLEERFKTIVYVPSGTTQLKRI